MDQFVEMYRILTGVSREYAIAVWYGLSDDMRNMPLYAAEIKFMEFKGGK